MSESGTSKRLPLYLSDDDCEVTNWCGTLRFKVFRRSMGKHNMCGKVLHLWFDGPDGFVWLGRHMGDFNTIVHARRTAVRSSTHNNKTKGSYDIQRTGRETWQAG